MNKKLLLILSIAMVVMCLSGINAGEVDTDGATPGKWTMDFEAAKKVAKEKKLPLILNFTGSDWCGWCKLMDKNVFAKDDWKKYSKENMMMVYVDFPKDKKLVPEKYATRNEALKEKYGIKGYPTYIILDDNGETVLGQTSAGKEKTPTSFIGELSSICRYTDGNVQAYIKKLKPADQKSYLALVTKLQESNSSKAKHLSEVSKLNEKIESLSKTSIEFATKAQEFRASMLSSDELKKYKELKLALTKAEKVLGDWLKTKPDRSQENMTKFQTMNSSIMSIKSKIANY